MPAASGRASEHTHPPLQSLGPAGRRASAHRTAPETAPPGPAWPCSAGFSPPSTWGRAAVAGQTVSRSLAWPSRQGQLPPITRCIRARADPATGGRHAALTRGRQHRSRRPPESRAPYLNVSKEMAGVIRGRQPAKAVWKSSGHCSSRPAQLGPLLPWSS